MLIEFICSAMPARTGKTGVGRDQRQVECLRKRDIGGVVGREPPLKLPDPIEQLHRWIPLDREVRQILYRCLCTRGRRRVSEHQPPRRGHHLEIEHVRGVQSTRRGKLARRPGAAFPVVEKVIDDQRGISDEHRGRARALPAPRE